MFDAQNRVWNWIRELLPILGIVIMYLAFSVLGVLGGVLHIAAAFVVVWITREGPKVFSIWGAVAAWLVGLGYGIAGGITLVVHLWECSKLRQCFLGGYLKDTYPIYFYTLGCILLGILLIAFWFRLREMSALIVKPVDKT